jgi:hypothetical protein
VSNPNRPNLAPGRSIDSILVRKTPNQWFDPTAFQLQTPGTPGNFPRNVLTGPRFFNVDLALQKNTALHYGFESLNVVFRAEAFNVLNHTNFNNPSATIFSGLSGAFNPNAGRITSAATPRQLQFALKFVF